MAATSYTLGRTITSDGGGYSNSLDLTPGYGTYSYVLLKFGSLPASAKLSALKVVVTANSYMSGDQFVINALTRDWDGNATWTMATASQAWTNSGSDYSYDVQVLSDYIYGGGGPEELTLTFPLTGLTPYNFPYGWLLRQYYSYAEQHIVSVSIEYTIDRPVRQSSSPLVVPASAVFRHSAAAPSLWQGLERLYAPCLGASGNRLTDIAGRTPDAAVNGTVNWQGTTHGQGLRLNGTDAYVTGERITSWGSEATLAWFGKFHSAPGSGKYINLIGQASSSYCSDLVLLYYSPNGPSGSPPAGIQMQLGFGTSSWKKTPLDAASKFIPSLDRWHLIVGRLKGGQMELWIDGERYSQDTADTVAVGENPLVLGRHYSSGNYGYLDATMAWAGAWPNRALTPREIGQLFDDPLAVLRMRQPAIDTRWPTSQVYTLTASGTLTHGGATPTAVEYLPPSLGGINLGGHGEALFPILESASGGLSFTGSSAPEAIAVDTGSGGTILAGTGPTQGTFAPPAIGGAVLVGLAGPTAVTVDTAAGRLLAGSSAAEDAVYTSAGDGRSRLSGSPRWQFSASPLSSGGVAFSGDATALLAFRPSISGRARLSGSVVSPSVYLVGTGGSLVVGGNAAYAMMLPLAGSGVLALAGDGAVLCLAQPAAGGRLETAGSAYEDTIYTTVASGPVAVSGEALGQVRILIEAGDGGLLLEGSGEPEGMYQTRMIGRLAATSKGAATVAYAATSGVGGMVGSGIAPAACIALVRPSGGLVVDGVSDDTLSGEVVASGRIGAGGSGVTVTVVVVLAAGAVGLSGGAAAARVAMEWVTGSLDQGGAASVGLEARPAAGGKARVGGRVLAGVARAEQPVGGLDLGGGGVGWAAMLPAVGDGSLSLSGDGTSVGVAWPAATGAIDISGDAATVASILHPADGLVRSSGASAGLTVYAVESAGGLNLGGVVVLVGIRGPAIGDLRTVCAACGVMRTVMAAAGDVRTCPAAY